MPTSNSRIVAGYNPDYGHIYYYNAAGQIIGDPGAGNLATIPNMLAGLTNGMTVIGGGAADTRFSILTTGNYLVTGQFTCLDGTPLFESGIAISVNGGETQIIHSLTESDNTATMKKTGSCSGIIALSSSDLVRLCWKNEAGAGNNSIFYAQLTLLQVTGL